MNQKNVIDMLAEEIGQLTDGYADPGKLSTHLRKPWDDWKLVVRANALGIVDIKKGAEVAKNFRRSWARYKRVEGELQAQHKGWWEAFDAYVVRGEKQNEKTAEKLGRTLRASQDHLKFARQFVDRALALRIRHEAEGFLANHGKL